MGDGSIPVIGGKDMGPQMTQQQPQQQAIPFSIVEQDGTEHTIGGKALHGKVLGNYTGMEVKIEELFQEDRSISMIARKALDSATSETERMQIAQQMIDDREISTEKKHVHWHVFFRVHSQNGFVDIKFDQVKRIVFKYRKQSEKQVIARATPGDIAAAERSKKQMEENK